MRFAGAWARAWRFLRVAGNGVLLEVSPMSDMTEYLRTLNEYHVELASVAALSAYLLDVSIDLDGDEWHKSGCFLMRNRLVEIAENLPFPPSSASKDAGGGWSAATPTPASLDEDGKPDFGD
jgi:hypothetical protein